MSFSFLDAILGKTARTEKRRPVSLKKRRLRLEHLENRELLAVTFGDADYVALQSQYSDLNLAQDLTHYNVIEIQADQLTTAGILQAKITEAGSTAKDDLIVIRTTDTQNKITLSNEILIDTKSSSMTMGSMMGKIIIVGYGSEELTIDANSRGRAFNIKNSADVTLVGLNIVNGKNSTPTTTKDTSGNGGAIASMGGSILTLAYSNVSGSSVTGKLSSGGGIYSENSTLTVIRSDITGNTATVATASVGGGVYVSGGTAIFRNSTIADNLSQGGGGIASIGGADVQLYGTTVSGNTASSSGTATSSRNGGGIYSIESYLSIAENSNIVGNSADKSGGGIYMTKAKATVTITDSVISDNNALTTSTSGEGGAIFVDTDLSVTKTKFEDNRAGKGAAIAVKDSAKVTVTIIGSEFIGNEAKSRGGAIELPGTGATLIVKNSVFERNLATDSHGGAIYTAATVTISTSEFTNNSAHTGGAIYSTGFTTVNEFSTFASPFVEASTDNPGEVGLTWNEVSHAAYYSVWIKAGDADWRRIGGNIYGMEYTHTNPPSGTVEYAVKAHSGTTTSEMSPVTVDIPLQLADPLLNASIQSGGTVSLAWNNVANALGYVVYRREAGADRWIEIGTTTSSERTYSDVNAPFGEYEYCVTAVNDLVYSESNVVPVNITLDNPASLVTDHDSSGVTLTWSAVDRAEYYSVWIKVGDNAWTKIANKEFGTSYVASNPPAGTVKYGVKAHNGSLTSTTTISSTLNVPLQPPATLNGDSPANGIVNLTWTAVAEATSYSVWLKNALGQWENVETNVIGTSFTHATSLYGWQEYAVKAHTATLASEQTSTMVDVQVTILPPEPVATALPNGTVSITWDAVDGAEIYGVFRCPAGTDDWIDLDFVDGTSFIDDTVTPGQYDYTVIAYAGWDESLYNIVTVTVPEASTLTATDNGDGSVSLNWAAVDGATKYTVWRQAEGETSATMLYTIGNGTTTSYTDTDVPSGTYTYFVRAIKTLSTIKIIESAPVQVVEIVTVPVLDKPTVDTDGNVNLSWTPATAAVNYIVQRRVAGGAWERIATATTAGYVDTTAPDGMVEYRVRANFGGGNVGDFSNIVKSAVNIPTQPWGTKPQLSYDLDANGYVILSWIEIEDSTRYVVQVNVDGGGWVNLVANLNIATYTDATLRTGTVQYRVRVFQDSEVVTSNPLTIV